MCGQSGILTDMNNTRWRTKAVRSGVVILLALAAVGFVATWYKNVHFGDAKIDEILFYFNNGVANGQSGSVIDAVLRGVPYAIGLFVVLLLPLIPAVRQRVLRGGRTVWTWLSQRVERLKLVRMPRYRHRLRHQVWYAAVLFIIASWQLLQSFHVPAYIHALSQSTDLYEQHYVDPAKVTLHFPSKKRNLIYIYLESVENTVMSRANGGQMDQSRMPELEKLALENLSFSHRDKGLGGALPANGTTWTVAGLTASKAGVPLKDGGLLGRDRNGFGDFHHFMPGAVTLGQLLEREGYNQTFMMGSDSAFGGRDKLLKQHGNYHIIDYPSQQATGKVPRDYKVWWGYEDKKLFQFAREEATRLAASNKPFNLQLLTVDTHFTDGWMDESCQQQFPEKYSNVHACSSRQVGEFVAWLKQQSFYDNTTIIVTGDHLGMQTDYYNRSIKDAGYQRTIFNAIVNPAQQPQRHTNRLFSSFDMYPTTLAAMGVKVDGEQLGLGVNLFSDKQTLTEQFGGIDALNAELAKRSSFYERKIVSGPPRKLE